MRRYWQIKKVFGPAVAIVFWGWLLWYGWAHNWPSAFFDRALYAGEQTLYAVAVWGGIGVIFGIFGARTVDGWKNIVVFTLLMTFLWGGYSLLSGPMTTHYDDESVDCERYIGPFGC